MKLNEIIDHPEASWTPEQLEHEARCWQDQYGRNAADFNWKFDPDFPLSKIAGDWSSWFQGEVKMWADEGQPRRYTSMLKKPIQEAICVALVDGQIEIWDGNHRIGASFVAGRSTIPAIVGTPK